MAGHTVTGQGDHLAPSLAELGGQPGGLPQFCGADWGEVRGVREQDAPAGGRKYSNQIIFFSQFNIIISAEI